MSRTEPPAAARAAPVAMLVNAGAAAALAGWLIVVGLETYDFGSATAQAILFSDLRSLGLAFTRFPVHVHTAGLLALFLLAAMGVGGLALLGLDPGWEGEADRALYALATGLAVLTYAGIAIAWLGLLVPPVLYGMLAFGLAAAAAYLAAAGRRLRQRGPPALPALRPGSLALGLFCAAFLYLAFLAALGPEVQFDAMWYHLGVPYHLVLHHGYWDIVRLTRITPAGLPGYQEVLYAELIGAFGVGTAKLLHWADAALAAAATVEFGRRRLGSLRTGLLAAVVFVSVPAVTWSAATGSNDLPGAFLSLLTLSATLSWARARDNRRWLVLAAITGGYAAGVKPFDGITLLICAALVAYLTWRRDGPSPRLLAQRLGLPAAIAAACCLPWWATSYALTGNPIFPALNELFHSPYWAPAASDYARSGIFLYGATWDLRSLLLLPWDTVVHADRYRALVGPAFLLLLPFTILAALPPRRSRLLAGLAAFSAAWLAIWFVTQALETRYLEPLLPVLALVVALTVAWAPVARPAAGFWRVPATLVVLLATLLNAQPLVAFQRYSLAPAAEARADYQWDYLYRGEPEGETFQIAPVRMVRYLNTTLDPGRDKVYDGCLLTEFYLYTHFELFNGSFYDSPARIGQWTLRSPDAFDRLREAGVDYVVLCADRADSLDGTPLGPRLVRVPVPADLDYALFRLETPG